MDWKQFTAAIVASVLSWPVMILVVALLLLKPLKHLIDRVRAAKGAGVSLEFGDLLESVEENVDEARQEDQEPAADTPPSQAGGPIEDPWIPDPVRDPSGAIMMAWKDLAETLEQLNRANASPGRPTRKPDLIIDQLARNGVIGDAFRESAVQLLELRNQVAHGLAVPTAGAARTYVERANQLRSLARALSPRE